MQPIPIEFTSGMFFNKIRQRFHLCGIRPEPDGEFFVLKCLGCGAELSYDWLLKRPDQEWIGDFSKRMKHNLLTNHAHKKCRPVIQEQQKSALQKENTTLGIASVPTPTTIIQQATIAPVQNVQNVQNVQQNIVIVNLPAVTRTGSTGDPLMCSDIPYPDAKTVKQLLDHPESAISEFVYKRFLNVASPSITAPDASNTKLKVVHRDNFGNHWVDVPLDATVDNLVYNTLDSLDDTFDAMRHNEFKDWKVREGLTAATGFDKTEAYQKMQNDVVGVLKQHGPTYI